MAQVEFAGVPVMLMPMLSFSVAMSGVFSTTDDHARPMIESALWRSVFMAEESPPSEASIDSHEPSDFGAASQDQPLALIPSELTPQLQAPLVIESDDSSVTSSPSVEVAEPETARLSDWDRALVKATGKAGKTFTSNGPSVVSIVVAMVGFIVVGGAYLTKRD